MNWKEPLILDLFESKESLMRKNNNLTGSEKEWVLSFFDKYPQLESKIDWNNIKNLTFEDFDKIMHNYKSKRTLKKQSTIINKKTLLELGAELIWEGDNGEFLAYVYTFDAAEYAGRSSGIKVEYEEGENEEVAQNCHWCISNSESQWNDDREINVTRDENGKPSDLTTSEYILWYDPKEHYPYRKIMIMLTIWIEKPFDKENSHTEITRSVGWNQKNQPDEGIYDIIDKAMNADRNDDWSENHPSKALMNYIYTELEVKIIERFKNEFQEDESSYSDFDDLGESPEDMDKRFKEEHGNYFDEDEKQDGQDRCP